MQITCSACALHPDRSPWRGWYCILCRSGVKCGEVECAAASAAKERLLITQQGEMDTAGRCQWLTAVDRPCMQCLGFEVT